MKNWIVVLGLLVLMLMSGCNEQWGEGDTPANWQESFGNSNLARLNFLQSQVIKRQEAALYGYKDPNGVVRVGLIEQLGVLEKQNDAQHKKIGETQISFQERIKGLEALKLPKDHSGKDSKVAELNEVAE